MSPRTLRAANATLYLCLALLVLAAAVYACCTREGLWQQGLALAGGLVALLWAAYYISLRYTVNAMGICERRLGKGTRCLPWTELERAELQHKHMQEVESLTLLLHSKQGFTMSLSSELLSLEAMEELVEEMRRAGILKD